MTSLSQSVFIPKKHLTVLKKLIPRVCFQKGEFSSDYGGGVGSGVGVRVLQAMS